MHVISVKKLRDFWTSGYADSEQPLKAWYQEVKKADWKGPANIKTWYPSASFLKNDRVVFNISGNKYRLVVRVRYRIKRVYIRFIGTHAQYDKINAEGV